MRHSFGVRRRTRRGIDEAVLCYPTMTSEGRGEGIVRAYGFPCECRMTRYAGKCSDQGRRVEEEKKKERQSSLYASLHLSTPSSHHFSKNTPRGGGEQALGAVARSRRLKRPRNPARDLHPWKEREGAVGRGSLFSPSKSQSTERFSSLYSCPEGEKKRKGGKAPASIFCVQPQRQANKDDQTLATLIL